MTFPSVSRRGRHFANVGDVIIYPDLVVARTDGLSIFFLRFSVVEGNRSLCVSSSFFISHELESLT